MNGTTTGSTTFIKTTLLSLGMIVMVVHGFSTSVPFCSQGFHYHGTECYIWNIKAKTATARQTSLSITTRKPKFTLFAADENQRYKFGDITRRLVKNNFIDKVNDLTGKEQYQFGDLSKYLDQRAKERVFNARSDGNYDDNNRTTYQYQFGDLTLWADNIIKERAAEFAGKGKNASEYEFGDISKTIIRKVQAGEYDVGDVFLALRVLISAGFMITPIASILPFKGLVALLNFGLKEQLSGRVVEVLATELDKRMKDALVINSSNIGNHLAVKAGSMLISDMAKDKLQSSLTKFTGKTKYEVGDIVQSITNRSNKDGKNPLMELSPAVFDQLTKWDKGFIQKRL